jgi:hypothetical protein
MKSLFNEYEAINREGRKLGVSIEKAINPIVQEWAFYGYSIRDIEAILIANVTVICAEKRLVNAVYKKKEM